MAQHHKYSISEIESWIVFERDIYVTMLSNYLKDLEEKLKKYTNGDNHKRYYEKNKDKIKEQGATYLKKLKEDNPESWLVRWPHVVRLEVS